MKNYRYKFLLLLFLFYSLLFPFFLNAYIKPAEIPDNDWEVLSPYFLPETHPIKAKLDQLIPDTSVLVDKSSLKKKGFYNLKERRSGMIVASHDKLKDYKLKIFLHNNPLPDYLLFLTRIQGAEMIRESINRHNFNHLMKVPQKWIYPVTPAFYPLRVPQTKFFVLVVEDMHTYPPQSNVVYYKEAVTREQIYALYTIINENNLFDSVYVDNIPMCMDQRIAFLDTEHFRSYTVPINWDRLLKNIRSKYRPYLQNLIHGGAQ